MVNIHQATRSFLFSVLQSPFYLLVAMAAFPKPGGLRKWKWCLRTTEGPLQGMCLRLIALDTCRLISDSDFVIFKAKAETWQATCYDLSLL